MNIDNYFELVYRVAIGMGGLVRAGRTEVSVAIFGLDNRATGKVYIKGKEMPLGNVNEAMRHRIALLPEDRKRSGLVLAMSVGVSWPARGTPAMLSGGSRGPARRLRPSR